MTLSVTFWGAGSFAQALASRVSPDTKSTTMWGRSEQSVRSSLAFVSTTTCVTQASQSDIWIFCVPAQALRSCLSNIRTIQPHRKPVLGMITCKGIERSSGMLMTEVFKEIFPNIPVAVLGGPNFASELLQGALSGMTIGTETIESFLLGEAIFDRSQICLQHVVSAEALSAWGALKNVAAVACGAVWGITQSYNTLCTFMAQAFVESTRWIEGHLSPEAAHVALSYGGFGDFVMTCTSQSSRNFRYGISLVDSSHTQGRSTAVPLVEGIESLYGILARNASLHLTLPFATTLECLLSQRIDPERWLQQLCASYPSSVLTQ